MPLSDRDIVTMLVAGLLEAGATASGGKYEYAGEEALVRHAEHIVDAVLRRSAEREDAK